MKILSFLTSLALANSVIAQADKSPGTEPAEKGELALLPNQKAFLNLPEEQRKEFLKNLGEAARLFQDKRIFETLDRLHKAQAIFKDSPEIYNYRGSCYVEMRAFDKALEDFQKALELSKNNVSVEFNIAEVYFVTREWKKAADAFEKILKVIPEKNASLGRLVEFKILLCKKKLGLEDEVTILSGKYTFEDDSPFYYFAQAALAYEADDLVKAEEWLAMASRVFQDPAVLAPWQDTMVEYGYIKSFYGGDTGEGSN